MKKSLEEIKTWKEERKVQLSKQEIFLNKLKADCPRFWRELPEEDFFSYSAFETWNDLIYQMSVDIEKVLTTIEEIFPLSKLPYVIQCKEKFGQLRVYYSECPAVIQTKIEDIIARAERKSAKICVNCGISETTCVRSRFPKPNDKCFFGYILPYCDKCFLEESLKRAKKSTKKELRSWYYNIMKTQKLQTKQ